MSVQDVRKICPLLSAGYIASLHVTVDTRVKCDGSKCALWNAGRCRCGL